MYVNIIDSYRNVIAICDKELIGKTFEEGISQLDVKENFYKGELKTLDQVQRILENGVIEDCTFNIVGERSVKAALEKGVITQENILKIQDIPYALILM